MEKFILLGVIVLIMIIAVLVVALAGSKKKGEKGQDKPNLIKKQEKPEVVENSYIEIVPDQDHIPETETLTEILSLAADEDFETGYLDETECTTDKITLTEMLYGSGKLANESQMLEITDLTGNGILTEEEKTGILNEVENTSYDEESESETGLLFPLKEENASQVEVEYETGYLEPESTEEKPENGYLEETHSQVEVKNEEAPPVEDKEEATPPEDKEEAEGPQEKEHIYIGKEITKDFIEEDLNKIVLKGCKVSGSFLGSDLSDAVIVDTVFTDCNMKFATLKNALLKNVIFENANFDKTEFDFAVLTDVKFVNCNFTSKTSVENIVTRIVSYIDCNEDVLDL